jgi:hypothetical protein
MSRKLLFIALLAAVPFPPLRAQEQDQQQSLGDIARQARKAKEDRAKASPPAQVVITEDSLPTRRTVGLPNAAAPDRPDASAADHFAEASADFDDAERSLNELQPLDRDELAKVALPGQNADFPGRRAWEDKLFVAKQGYISHGRVLLREARGLLDEIKSLSTNEKTPASKSKMQELSLRLRQVMQDSLQTEANFQAILVEGQKLANQSTSN